MANPNPPQEHLKPGTQFEKTKKDQAEAWNEFMDVPECLKELTEMGMRFLRGHRKMTKEQSTVWKAMYEKMSDKVIPTAKQDEDNKNIKITVKKPDEC